MLGGLICFLMLWCLVDGNCNVFYLMCLKDKFGDWVNVFSEVELCGVWVWWVGEEGCGVVIIIGMVMMMWLDCMFGVVVEMCMVLV